MNKIEVEAAAHEVADSLLKTENAIESAVHSIAALVATLPKLKLEAGLTIFHGQDVLEISAELISLLSAARRKSGELHRRLDAGQKMLGLEPISFGAVGKPPEEAHPSMREVRRIA